jgi:hypothetical protein
VNFLPALKIAVGIALMSTASARAATAEGMPGSPPVIPPKSTERFLDGVRDYGNGQPSPSIIYPTAALTEANSPDAKGPSVLSTGTPPEHVPLSGSGLRGGGTLERRTNQPYRITPGTIEKRDITPPVNKSTWQ